MSDQRASALPYAVPQGWSLRKYRFGNAFTLVAWLVVAIGFVAAFWWSITARADGFMLWFVVGFVVAACVAGSQLDGWGNNGTEPPTLINAVTMMAGDDRAPIDWAHFFRKKPEGVLGNLIWFLTGTGGVLLCAITAVSRILRGESIGFMVFVIGVLCIIVASVGGEGLVHGYRDRRWAEIPVGILLTRAGIAVRELDRFDIINWRDIVSVRTGQPVEAIANPKRAVALVGQMPTAAMLTVTRNDGFEISQRLDNYAESPWLVYTTVRFNYDNPELRKELTTSVAQRRMEEWNNQIRNHLGAT